MLSRRKYATSIDRPSVSSCWIPTECCQLARRLFQPLSTPGANERVGRVEPNSGWTTAPHSPVGWWRTLKSQSGTRFPFRSSQDRFVLRMSDSNGFLACARMVPTAFTYRPEFHFSAVRPLPNRS